MTARPPRESERTWRPSVKLAAGALGESLASTISTGSPTVRRYEHGRLVRARIGGDTTRLTLPDGSKVTTAGMPLGELVAAQRASGAPSAVAASTETPTGAAVAVVLPIARVLLRISPLRTLAKRRLARVKLAHREPPRQHSWAHGRVDWPDSTTREGWLRLGSASVFTAATSAEVARRLLAGEGRPGAYTPGRLFRPSLAEACGGEFFVDPSAATPK